MAGCDESTLILRPELQGVAEGFSRVQDKLAKGRPIRLVLMDVVDTAERFVRVMCTAGGTAGAAETVDESLRELADGGVVPEAIATSLQTVCILGNHARRGTRGVPLTPSDAEDMINLLLQALEWHYCENALGPRLTSIYAEKAKSEDEQVAEARELLSGNPQFRDSRFWLTVDPAVVARVAEAMQEAVQACRRAHLAKLTAELAALRGDA